MYDYGFWIIDTATGANESTSWNVFEGWTVHVNATSTKADQSVGGTAYHGIGIELNATGNQLLTVNAGVGKWVAGSFVAPNHAYYHQHIWCTVYCGPGHGGMQSHILNVVPSTIVPHVTVQGSPTNGTAPLTVTFKGSVTGGTAPVATAWNFGDGTSTSGSVNTTHTYTLSGSYTAVLTATDAVGYVASGSVPVSVGTSAPLNASARLTPASGYVTVRGLVLRRGGRRFGRVLLRMEFRRRRHRHRRDSLPCLHVRRPVHRRPDRHRLVRGLGEGRQHGFGDDADGHAQRDGVRHALRRSRSRERHLRGVRSRRDRSDQRPVDVRRWDGRHRRVRRAFVRDRRRVRCDRVRRRRASGRMGHAFVHVNVTGASGSPFRVWLVADPTAGAPPLRVGASVSLEGGSGSYLVPTWGFGDGSSASGSLASHDYASLGAFSLSVTALDSLGATASSTATITVEGLQVTVTANTTTGDAPFAVQVGASVVGGSGTYLPVAWTWGDGSTASGTTANHTYSPAVNGTLEIRATVTDSAGTSATGNLSVQILPPPAANLTVTVANVGVPADERHVLASRDGRLRSVLDHPALGLRRRHDDPGRFAREPHLPQARAFPGLRRDKRLLRPIGERHAVGHDLRRGRHGRGRGRWRERLDLHRGRRPEHRRSRPARIRGRLRARRPVREATRPFHLPGCGGRGPRRVSTARRPPPAPPTSPAPNGGVAS